VYQADLGQWEIKQIQPDFSEWISSQKATLSHFITFHNWDINVPEKCKNFTLLNCIEIAALCPPQRMCEMGLNLETMIQKYGLQFQEMPVFPFDVCGWVELGFVWEIHAVNMPDAIFCSVFKNTKQQMYPVYLAHYNKKNQIENSNT
jgi:hypothetical protein